VVDDDVDEAILAELYGLCDRAHSGLRRLIESQQAFGTQ